jgi:hypothetical protein
MPPIETNNRDLNGRLYSKAELHEQIALKTGGTKGIGMTEE